MDKTNSDVSLIRAAQFSVNPNIVRLVIYSSSNTIQKTKTLSFNKNESDFILKLDNYSSNKLKQTKPVVKDLKNENKQISYVKAKEIVPNQPPAILNFLQKQLKEINTEENKNIAKSDKMKINSVKLVGNSLTLSGNGSFGEKKFFTLDSPNRLVFDFDKTVINSKELLKTYKLNNNDTIKLGQFTPNSIRIVVETENPDKFKAYLSPNMDGFTLSADGNATIYNTATPKFIGKINNIKVENQTPEITSVKIESSTPVIYNFFRSNSPDKFNLEFYNIRKPANTLLASLIANENLKGVKTENLLNFKSGSAFSFPINSNIRTEVKINADGKIIELLFKNKFKKFQPAQPSSQADNDDLTKRKMIISPLIRKVVIDPGHGGSDVGATRAGIFEKDITLDVANKLAKYLEKSGVTIVFTRTSDASVSLKDRAFMANNENPDIFVSVHVNSSTSATPKGLETHWFTPQSKELATSVQEKLVQSVNSNNRGICNSMFYVIHHTLPPSILVEIGFISNDNERSELLTSSRQDATAKAIADGILKYLENKGKP
jgi:N-acetylmuramoyl-L-alanine amidase